ncbi:MAG: CBS domain-containing protein, partial [Polyangiaceae bacterium]
FGGVSNIEREPPSPGAEFLTAIVGPATSIALGVTALFFGTLFTGAVAADVNDPQSLAASLNPLSTLLMWLGPVNILVGIFNLIPGFPLDGGRILRAILWSITGDLRTSTRTACGVGQAVGWTFIVLGIAMSFGARVPFFGTGLGGGLWLAFIGWFLNGAAAQSYQRVVLEDVLSNVPVWRLMRSHGAVIPAELTLADAARDFFMNTDEQAFPVMMDGKLGGILTLRDVRKVPQDKWGEVKLTEVMTPTSQLATVTPDDWASDALVKMMQLDVSQLPVTQDERLIGMLRRRDVARWIELQVHPGDHLPQSFAS